MIYCSKNKLFSDEELSVIDSMWDNKNTHDKSFIPEKYGKRKYIASVCKTKESDIVVKKMLDFFENSTGETLINKDFHLIIHRYTIGDFFDKHNDSGNAIVAGTDNIGFRKYTLGMNLNDDYDGGEFIAYDNENKIILGEKRGYPYVMSANTTHEVTKIKNGMRKSILIFICSEDLKKNGII